MDLDQRERSYSFMEDSDNYWDENETLFYEPPINPFIKVKSQDEFLDSILNEHNIDNLNIKIPTKSEEYHKGLPDCNRNKFYKKPYEISKSVFTIWEQAGLRNEECFCQIEIRLVKWVNTYATIKADNISWKCNKTLTSYNSSWNTFIKWILCCCNT